MESGTNKENDARSLQENTAKRLSVDTNNTSTLQSARPVLQEIETLSNERVLIEQFGTSFQQDGKDITFVDIQSNVTADPFFSPNSSYDPLGTYSQSEKFDTNSLTYSTNVEEDLFYSIEYMPDTQSKYLTIPFDGDRNNTTFDTTESSRIFGIPSNSDSCNIESFSDTPSYSSEVETVKDSTVNLDPRSLNVTFEKTPLSYAILTEEPTAESPLKNSSEIVTENCCEAEMEDKVKVVESSLNKTQNVSEIIENQSEFREKYEIVNNSIHSEVATEDCDMKDQIVNPNCSANIFNPFQISCDSDIDSLRVDDEIKLQEKVTEVITTDHKIAEDAKTNYSQEEVKDLVDDEESEINKENLGVEIMDDQNDEAEVVACCAALENLNVTSSKQEEESIGSAVESSNINSEELQILISRSEDALSIEEEFKQPTEVPNISQVDRVNTDQVYNQTEEPPKEDEIVQVITDKNIEDASNDIPQTNTEITKSFSVVSEEQIAIKVIQTVENDTESQKTLEASSQIVSESDVLEESAKETELNKSTEQVLNETIDNFQKPVHTKVNCRPNIRSLRQKTQVIAHPLIVKPISADNVSDAKVKEFKEKELQLKNELDKLQVELTEIQKENEIKDKCILANVLAMQANRDRLEKYKTTINHYQTFINKQNSDLSTLKMDTEQLEKEFSNMEMAFADVFNKYEKAKLIIEAYKQNEETLNKNIEGVEKQVDYMDDKCKQLQNKYEQTVKQVQDKVNQERETNKSKLLNLRTSVKRLEIMASSLETALKQKTEECQALAAFCEDMGRI